MPHATREQRNAYARQYYQEHREHAIVEARKRHLRNMEKPEYRERRNETNRRRRAEHPELHRN